MPTQEERLTALEKTFATFRQETGTHIKETEENTTIMLGVMRSQGQDIRKIFQRIEAIGEHMSTTDQRLDTMNTRLESIDERLKRVENMLTQILARLPEKP
jgi:ABC-type transporter Mla subunit MlaD